MKPILEIQNISKKFVIDHEQKPYLSLRDSISGLFKSKQTHEDFWALKDISFDVNEGDTIGIIGKNGAGKSTLLKILSRITPPTSGKIISRGRIASLLEVGTGFHPELSGRENIYMNGSILGMKRTEIRKNFDAIVDFAGVERFIDTPLKHYSSGMQLRLAFAVAAFLENEVLIIDEVLAVGDAEFQKKCIGKMEDVSKSGRTILFVSHNMGAVKNLCEQAIYLEQGRMLHKGKTEEIITEYLLKNVSNIARFDSDIKYLAVSQKNCDIVIHAEYELEHEIDFPHFGFVIYNYEQLPVFGSNPSIENIQVDKKSYRKGRIEVTVKSPILNDGNYSLSAWFGDRSRNFFEAPHCIRFHISGASNNLQYPPNIVGNVSPQCEWKIN